MGEEGWVAFGAELREARRRHHRSLREVATAVSASHSTIHRLEQGLAAGRQDIVRALDDLYAAGGHFVDTYGRLMYPLWIADGGALRMDDQQARCTWQHSFPARHSGEVWILVRPTAGSNARAHRVELHWGPWFTRLSLDGVTSPGVSLVTGKSGEDIAAPLRVVVDPAAHLLFGTDDERMPLADIRPIHDGWRLADNARVRRSALQSLAGALRLTSRSTKATSLDGKQLDLARKALGGLSPETQRLLETALREESSQGSPTNDGDASSPKPS